MRQINISSLESSTNKLLGKLNQFTQSQKKLWQKIPWLALEADGRCDEDYPKGIATAYQSGYWRIDIDRCHTFIDLATGELVCLGGKEMRYPPGKEKLLMILAHPEKVDAGEIIAILKKAPRPLHSSKAHEKPLINEWREKTRIKYNVKKIFVREKKK